MTLPQLLFRANELGARYVNLVHVDWRHGRRQVTVPLRALQTVGENHDARLASVDVGAARLIPEHETAVLDPFCQATTIAIVCECHDAATGLSDPWDTRALARRAVQAFAQLGLAGEVLVASEVECHILDQASFAQDAAAAHYQLDSREGWWRRGSGSPDNLGVQLPPGAGESQAPPFDSLLDLRSEIAAVLGSWGVSPVRHSHAPDSAGHCCFSFPPLDVVSAADALMSMKYVARNVAARHGKVATFMAQPFYGGWGSALELRLDLRHDGQSLLFDKEDGRLGVLGRNILGGWLGHGRGLAALTCPGTNSYVRLASDCRAPRFLTWSCAVPAAATWVPAHGLADAGLVYRVADPTCDPYVACSALLLAALDGITHDSAPPALVPDCAISPDDADSSSSGVGAGAGVGVGEGAAVGVDDAEVPTWPAVPESLGAALAALAEDQAYLTEPRVFSAKTLHTWMQQRKVGEIDALRRRPHPYEFCLYFNA